MADLARICGECSEFKFRGWNEMGVCKRKGETGYNYGVNPFKTNCLYGSPGKRVSLTVLNKRRDVAIEKYKILQEELKHTIKVDSEYT